MLVLFVVKVRFVLWIIYLFFQCVFGYTVQLHVHCMVVDLFLCHAF